MKKPLALFVMACLALSQALPAQASARHFRSSHDHFTEYAAMASDLFLSADDPAEKNTLGLLAASSSFYAERAYLVMQLTDILENMKEASDVDYVEKRIQDIKQFVLEVIRSEIKRVGDLAMSQENPDIKTVGNLIVNELRVFERNTGNL
ncbi:hypothetical protein G3N56_19340 [Desulfovibrio sulfodismutans]|uniref:Uncharacterized protein n=1 Tax=Desulfolutivibrio sulfodismutans TaxID=63561 RepID=A0A7K3NSX7_9BACT|nr:hypothetical protein [Desulfolutivibrio sulfodismutans]NDY58895.1 hypothetical protein [Desulfolutivibrio sulfodismutans]QLA14022.1 hypothetical protein GD606_17995 [Desulfolutivibrio sulfodismutans DSM 3696]